MNSAIIVTTVNAAATLVLYLFNILNTIVYIIIANMYITAMHIASTVLALISPVSLCPPFTF